MKIVYAFRRAVFHPYRGEDLALPPLETRGKYLAKVKGLGFEGLELNFANLGGLDASEETVAQLGQELTEAGLPCLAIRGGGGLHHPSVAVRNRRSLEKAVQVAAWIGATVINITVGTHPPPSPGAPGAFVGEPVSQGSSRLASEADFEITARGLSEVADMAAGVGVNISIEVHQHSIADNSWSALHLLELIDRPNVGVNPDLGNIYWAYDVPEESCEAAIVALAPHARYWHCKNMRRVHIPENEHAIFIRTPLPDGEIDYRFAISAMLEAGYDGYLAVEGMPIGDQLHGDGRSIAYVKGILKKLQGSE